MRGRAPAGERLRLVAPVSHDACRINVEQRPYLLGDGGEDLVRWHSPRDKRRHAPQRRLLLGEFVSRRLRDVSPPARVRGELADEDGDAEVEQQLRQVRNVGERERMRRGELEPVVGQQGCHRGRDCIRDPPGTLHGDDGEWAGHADGDDHDVGFGDREDHRHEGEGCGANAKGERHLGAQWDSPRALRFGHRGEASSAPSIPPARTCSAADRRGSRCGRPRAASSGTGCDSWAEHHEHGHEEHHPDRCQHSPRDPRLGGERLECRSVAQCHGDREHGREA